MTKQARQAEQPAAPALISVITPAYNEAANLPVLYGRLCQVLDSLGTGWEWLVIDDRSADDTFAVAAEMARRDGRIRVMRLSRNFGSHAAIACGLDHAAGDCAVVMAADLQDPPESLPALVAEWRSGAQVVWAVRAQREGEKASTIGFARTYYWIMRRFVGLREMPPTGADFFLVDRCVVEAFRRFPERNASVMALVTWMGFRQATVAYEKQARLHGRSGWSLEKKLKLAIDSITLFSYLPIRLMSYAGCFVVLVGLLTAAVALLGLRGPSEGWAFVIAVMLVLGGMQMVMVGVLGEYLWRALDEARRRPRYLVEATVEQGESGGLHAGEGA